MICLLYVLIFLTFFIVVPAINKKFFLNAWLSNDGTLVTIITYINAIFSALIVVFIFKTPQDDGSELIISAKPLSRNKVILIKFLIFITYSIFFSIISAVFVCFSFLSPNVNPSVVWSLIFTLILTHTICMFFFGSIAIVVSLFFNKTLVIMTNIFVVVVGAIYTITFKAVQKEPSSIITRRQQNGEFLVSTTSFVDQNGYGNYAESITSINPDEAISSLNIDYAKRMWNSVLQEANQLDLQLAFNMISQQQLIHCLGNLNEMYAIKNAMNSLGQNSWYNYKIQNKLIPSATENKLNATDDDYSWTSLSDKNLPLFYVDTSLISKSLLSSAVSINTKPDIPSDVELNTLLKIINELSTKETVSYLSPAFYIDDALFYDPTHSWNNIKGSCTSIIYDGVQLSKNIAYYHNQALGYTEFETDLFNYIIFKTLWESNNDFNNCFSLSGSEWKFNANETKFSKLIYETFKQYKNELKLNSIRDYGIEYLRLKNYIVYRLLGKYGYDNVTIDNKTLSEEKIIVPYSDYFNLCLLTQYNAINVRNIDEFSTTKMGDYVPRNLIKDGFIALPYIGSDSADWIDFLFKKDKFSTNKVTKKLSTDYDGTKTPSLPNYDDLYKQYDILNYTHNQKTDHYGYFSEISFRAQALIRSYASSNTLPFIEKNDQIVRDDHYISRVTMGSSKLFSSFERSLFTYSVEQKINPYIVLSCYLLISTLFLTYGYIKYIKYDFK